jgi:hypothetical protein
MLRILTLGIVAVFLSACTDAGLTPREGYIDVEGGKVWFEIVGSGTVNSGPGGHPRQPIGHCGL